MTLPGAWEVLSADQAESFVRELNTEIAPQHPLYGIVEHAIARSRRADDALFQISDGRVASVHLTWTQTLEQPPWPRHRIFESLDEWVRSVDDSSEAST